MKQYPYLLAVVILTIVLWNTVIIYPLKILVVFFHELSHALVVILTGGKVVAFNINQMEGGFVQYLGGNVFLTGNAGYLGSLIWGVLIYTVTVHTRKDRLTMGALGLLLILAAILFRANAFGLIYCFLAGLAMMACARYLGDEVCDFILRVIGVTSMLYVIRDVYSDAIARRDGLSDASMLAERYGGPVSGWAWAWLLLSGIVIVVTIYSTISHERKQLPE